MYYVGTLEQVTQYNDQVTQSEGYTGTTTSWATPVERDGNWYILINSKYYSSTMNTVEKLPDTEETNEAKQ